MAQPANKQEKINHGQFQSVYQKSSLWIAIHKGLFAQLMYAVPNNVTSGEMDTAYTTGTSRAFDKEFMDKLDAKQQAFVMAHEILHDALLHKHRQGRRDMTIWNYACDIKINNILIESGFEKPNAGVFDFKGKTYEGKSEEEIYDALMKEAEKNGGKGGQDGKGSPIPKGYEPDLQGGEPTEDQVAQMKGRLQTAVEMHGAGNLPQELQAAISAVLNPKEKWHEWLRKYFTSKQYSGADWTQMCRREYIRSGLIAPPYQSDSLGVVVISIDQSGSISGEMLEHFSGHVNSILLDCKPEKIVVQYFDTKVHETEEFVIQDLPIALRRVCGGGTSFLDCCKKAEDYEAAVHLILTDLEGSMPEASTVPTIWADFTKQEHKHPFGDLVKIEMED